MAAPLDKLTASSQAGFPVVLLARPPSEAFSNFVYGESLEGHGWTKCLDQASGVC